MCPFDTVRQSNDVPWIQTVLKEDNGFKPDTKLKYQT